MRLAAIADIHGNLPALRAVLDDVSAAHVDAITVLGDVAGGPLVPDCLELIAARPELVHWIAGNSEREAVAAYDGEATADDPAGRAAAFTARGLSREWRDRLAAWPITDVLGGVRLCHGSPRRDDEILTRATPEEVIASVLEDMAESLVIGGHTHQAFVRTYGDGRLLANTGSVGIPYEGRPGASWLIVEDGVPNPQWTEYDVEGAVAELRCAGYLDLDDQLDGSLIDPYDPYWVAAYFEHLAGRGQGPGPPVRAGASGS